jgi:HD-GYP domain-containing protein (c-di-GMP phosphodiesterase class II)
MKAHPVLGFEQLKGIAGIAPEILDGVRHHHEYLDGSGYPDGLRGGEGSDLVRLLIISDIFAALIELRPYRLAMPRQEAYDILCSMDGKLEGSLVKAFRNVALRAYTKIGSKAQGDLCPRAYRRYLGMSTEAL